MGGGCGVLLVEESGGAIAAGHPVTFNRRPALPGTGVGRTLPAPVHPPSMQLMASRPHPIRFEPFRTRLCTMAVLAIREAGIP